MVSPLPMILEDTRIIEVSGVIRRLVVLVLGTSMAVGLAACGGGRAQATKPDKPSGGSAISVVAEDIRFPVHTFSAAAGAITITYRNEGAIGHTLKIDGVEGFKLSVPAHGDVDKGTVQLQPGKYTLYCDIPGHRQAGMEATLEVR